MIHITQRTKDSALLITYELRAHFYVLNGCCKRFLETLLNKKSLEQAWHPT